MYKNEQKERKFWRKQKNFYKYVNFYKHKKVAKIDSIDVNRILVSKEEPYGAKNSFKYFVGYDDNDVNRPLCIKLPQMIGYAGKFEGNTTISFKISKKQLLKKYSQIRKKVGKLLKIEFNNKPVYGDEDKHNKTKIKTYGGRVFRLKTYQKKKYHASFCQ